MFKLDLRTISIISILILIYLVVKLLVTGISTVPYEGDSVYLHIPIARAILNGTIFQPHTVQVIEYPASSELILSAFLALHVPLNLYNVLALVLLFFALLSLGKTFGLSKCFAIIFAFTVVTLYGLLRYADTQKIDIWLLLFYVLSLNLLEKPKKTTYYFLLLGFFIGMVVGSKYSGPLYALILAGFYFKQIVPLVNIKRVFAFITSFSVFGLIWYIRNILNTGNPMYPQDFLFFKGNPDGMYYAWPYWKTFLQKPKGVVDALVSEYMVWVVSFMLLPIVLVYKKASGHLSKITEVEKLILLTLTNLLLFCLLPVPPANDYEAIVFGIRYSYPAIITAILCIYVLAQKYKERILVSIISLSNVVLILLPIPYRPKLIFFYIPALILGTYIVRRFFLKGFLKDQQIVEHSKKIKTKF